MMAAAASAILQRWQTASAEERRQILQEGMELMAARRALLESPDARAMILTGEAAKAASSQETGEAAEAASRHSDG